MHTTHDYHVLPTNGGRWTARMDGERRDLVSGSREEVIERARAEAEGHPPSRVFIHRPDGTVEESAAWLAPNEVPDAPSKVAILGHPVHPMLVPIPIGLLVLLPITDLIYWANGDPFWARTSFVLAIAGLVTAGLAALAGLPEFLLVARARRTKAGWIHLVLNVGAVVLVVANVFLRLDDRAAAIVPTGALLSIVTALVLGVSGWFGGELVYRHRIGLSNEPAAKDRPRRVARRTRTT